VVSIGTLIIVGLICLLGGGAIGALVFRSFDTRSQNRALEERAFRAEDELKRYQQDVAEHFAKTSELVNGLTQSYRDVYEHLANSALKLTTPALSRQILESANTQLLGTGNNTTFLTEEQIEAPRDWAPKTATGQLSEEYGLHEEHDVPGNPYDDIDDVDHVEVQEPSQPEAESTQKL